MIFHSYPFLVLFLTTLALYWALPNRRLQNALLLGASYVFYGWVHPWFCILIAASTVVDYLCGLGMARNPDKRRSLLAVSIFFNIGLLAVFKYFGFFVANVEVLLQSLGVPLNTTTLSILLPVGISFYTFQTMSYTIDVAAGRLKARDNFLDFAVFVAFFPQLVAGPIERAKNLLPQFEQRRSFASVELHRAITNICRGFFKKLVIADNVSLYADKIYALESPSLLLLMCGTLAFAIQIYTDFSGYTDIARGVAGLFGINLKLNFNYPYLACTPSDFWRRWHISLSSWIRDYLYFPLGGSRVKTRWGFFLVVVVTLGLSGLWHGAAWHFVLWGVFHGVLVFVYHSIGMGGRWRPGSVGTRLLSWFVMFNLVIVGWMLFRASDMGWLAATLWNFDLGFHGDSATVSIEILFFLLLYTIPLHLFYLLDQRIKGAQRLKYCVNGILVGITIVLGRGDAQDFIYFQF